MNVQASATSAWYAAVLNPATPPVLKARCRIRCARGMPCAAASALSRARSAVVTLSLISGIFGGDGGANSKSDAKTLSLTGFGRKRTQVGRKKPSHTKGGRKIEISPIPPIYVFCSRRYIPLPVSVPDLIYPYLRPNRRKDRWGLGFCVRHLRPICVRPGRKLRPTSSPQVQLET